MGQTWDTQIEIAKKVVLLNIILGIFGFFIFSPWIDFARGLVFGTAIAILNFRLLALTVEKSVLMEPDKAKIYAGTRYVIRYLINAVVLIVSLKADYINPLGTIIGLISIKFVVLRVGLFNDKSFFKKIFTKRKEEN